MKIKQTIMTALTLILASCGDSKETTSTETKKDLLPKTLMTQVAPAEAKNVTVAREMVKANEPITVTGTIGGVKAPFVDSRASFIIADHTTMKACGTTCTTCPTPWDFCCEPPETLQKSIVSVQVVDANGKVIKQGLKSYSGLTENQVVTISGKFSKNSSKNLILINAEKIYINK